MSSPDHLSWETTASPEERKQEERREQIEMAQLVVISLVLLAVGVWVFTGIIRWVVQWVGY